MHFKLALPVFAIVLFLADAAYGEDGYVRGDLRFLPSVNVSQAYDTNIYTTEDNETADYLTRVIPQVKIETISLPYSLELNGKLEQVWFADETQNHYLNFGASAKYRYRLDSDTTWDAFASIARLHEMPGDDEADPAGDASEPLPVNALRAHMSMRKEFDAFNMGFNLSPRMGVSNRDYISVRAQDGTMLDQGGRSRGEFMTGGRFGFRASKTTEVFFDGEYTPRGYKRDGLIARDSDGWHGLAGFKYKPSDAFLVEMAAGYMARDYKADVYDDIHAPDLALRASWNYAPESKVSLAYNRSINEVTEFGAGGSVVDDVKLAVTQQLLEDVSAKIEGRYRYADYHGGNGADNGTEDRADEYYGLSFGLQYNMTERTSLHADYTFGRNSSNESDAEYTQNVFLLGLKAGL